MDKGVVDGHSFDMDFIKGVCKDQFVKEFINTKNIYPTLAGKEKESKLAEAYDLITKEPVKVAPKKEEGKGIEASKN